MKNFLRSLGFLSLSTLSLSNHALAEDVVLRKIIGAESASGVSGRCEISWDEPHLRDNRELITSWMDLVVKGELRMTARAFTPRTPSIQIYLNRDNQSHLIYQNTGTIYTRMSSATELLLKVVDALCPNPPNLALDTDLGMGLKLKPQILDTNFNAPDIEGATPPPPL